MVECDTGGLDDFRTSVGSRPACFVVHLTQLADTAMRAIDVEDALAFYGQHDANLDHWNGGLAVVLCGVDEGVNLGRRQ
ncbi:MAG: hypothetical protein QOK02_833 [Mycobacterium sp.]|nr:hypothetical protein [Mycobacterium sp.]